ncbi:DUF3108 domain-containing protein [Flavobacterium sp.]|uniref:DUF3108 domain-containing protein n=1 Tax=Flavobacterium sp. TaxID=239 RepID=UPI00286A375A|nr:DUF3108 domain-containing protein [Flavobacterium sp.]
MKKYLLIFCFALSINCGFSQIKSGEKLVFAASYNMSGLMTQLAQVTMETETIKTSKTSYLHLSCQATTFSKWDSFFKIRDLYESYVHPLTLKPSLYKRNINEGGYTKTEKYVFKKDGKTVTSTSKKRNKPETNSIFTIGNSTQDIVTLIYKLRTVDFKNFKNGQTRSFVIVFDEKEIPVVVKFMGKETISAGSLGTKECYKLSIGARTKVLKGKDQNIIWLTADTQKIPALIKFSIPVGTGQLKLASASGI